MRLSKIFLRNFRNYVENTVEFSAGANVLVGDNGQGKTNILEAIWLLCSGDSFRPSENSNLIHTAASEARVQALIEEAELRSLVEVQLLKSRKNFSLNKKRITSPELRIRMPAVLFSPESLSAIKGGADERRDLIDGCLVSFEAKNAHLIYDFRKCLRTRNRLLRDFEEQKQSLMETESLLEAINVSFFRLASELTISRLKAISNLLPEINNAMQNILRESSADVQIEYLISSLVANQWSRGDIEARLSERATELRAAELASGTSLVGPQKHDIRFLFRNLDSRYHCSQGQQRALILSLKLAQIVYHRRAHGNFPLLLLDDVLSELDAGKREALIQFLETVKSQIFLTTTDLEVPAALAGNVSKFLVQNGQVFHHAH